MASVDGNQNEESGSSNTWKSLGGLFQSYQKIVDDFYMMFTEENSKKDPSAHQSNMKLQSKFLPDSYVEEVTNYWDFMKTIPWTESWMICLMLFHLFCFVVIITSKKFVNLQYTLFFALLVGVYFSEQLNEMAAENFKRYSRENFFDSNGLFISTVFSIPVLFNCICLITIWLSSSAQTLIQVKRKQISLSKQNPSQESKKEK